MPEEKRFLTIAEAARFLQVSQTSLRRWTNSGKLRSFRVGGRNERRFLKDDLLAFMSSADGKLELAKQATAQNRPPSGNHVHQGHISLFYLNPDEQWQMLRPYILEHLRTNLPVLYIQDSDPPYRILELLRTEGLPLEELIARGLLRVLPPAQTYLLGGSYDMQRMLSFLESAILGALETGYKGILITGEMTWTLEAGLDDEQLKAFEERVNPIFEKYPTATGVCQYDLRRFDGPSVLNVLTSHPLVHLPRGKVPGFYGLEKAALTS
jgi:excisionase family DNA binding protein